MNRSHGKAWVLTSSLVSALLIAQPIAAQVVPDNTLPAGERSQVTGNPNFQVDGGAVRGSNLFHSFSEFSVPTGGSTFFNNAPTITNIFSRITGTSVSNIDGLIRANGTANLFLLNPNGILFGPNASLNIGGSFVGTTANAIGFASGEVFSSDATQPLPSQLLNVNANALFFNQLAAQAIVNQSTAINRTGLRVPARQSLLLVGGDVRLEGGQMVSPGSRVELGAVAGQGSVGLSETADEWRLSFPDSVARLDVALNNRAGINVRAGGGGSIAVTARNVAMSQRSGLNAGIERELGFVGAQAGDVQVDATGAINIANSSGIGNSVLPRGTGNSGNINITTGSLSLASFSSLDNRLYGQGNAGNITIRARDTVSLDRSFITNSVSSTGFDSRISPGIGNAGDVNITTGSLSLTVGSQVNSFTAGRGNAGSVTVHARDTVSLDNQSVMFNNVFLDGIGNSGGINITTGSLYLTRLSYLLSDTEGQGNAGSVNIQARDTVLLDGTLGRSSITTQVGARASGQGGDVTITTGSLVLSNGGVITTRNSGGIGNAGRVTIQAGDVVQIRGRTPRTREEFSQVATSVTTFDFLRREAVGSGGYVTISTGSLSVTEGGRIVTNVRGRGRAGNIGIQASDTVLFDGGDAISTLSRGGVGRGGDIDITARSLSALNGAQLAASTAGQGDAGTISIATSDFVILSGVNAVGQASGLLTTTEPSATGSGGTIRVETGNLQVTNGAVLNARSRSTRRGGDITLGANTVDVSSGGQLLTSASSNGRAGDITVNTPSLQLSGATSGLFTGTTSVGDAGNLTIQSRGNGQSVRVNLQGGAQISASTSSSGRGGTLTITAPDSIALTGNGSIIAAETGGTGTGGNLILTTGDLNIQNQAEVTVSSSGTGSAGSLFMEADRIFLNNQGRIRADTSGGGGNIDLRSSLILLRNGSNITTNARGANIPGGNIGIDTRFLVAVLNENSNISANSEDFRGGNVRINAFSVFGIQPSLVSTLLSDITATGATSALPGTIDITTADIDPASGLVELPTDVVDASRLIAQGCPADQGNSFVITGRGGLPPTPQQELDDAAEWQDRSILTVAQTANREAGAGDRETDNRSGGYGNTEIQRHGEMSNSTSNSQASTSLNPPIFEANGWQITSAGEVILIANIANPTGQNLSNHSTNCHRY